MPRRKHFRNVIRKIGEAGVAIEDHCAIEFIGGKYRVVTAKPRAAAYRLYRRRGNVIEEKLETNAAWTPIAELYKKSSSRSMTSEASL